MNLDKLKELEGKATPKEWKDDGSGDIYTQGEKYQEYHTECKFSADATYIVELQNQAKEMIETIERYGAALEGIAERRSLYSARVLRLTGGNAMAHELQGALDDADTALKDPEKTLDISKS